MIRQLYVFLCFIRIASLGAENEDSTEMQQTPLPALAAKEDVTEVQQVSLQEPPPIPTEPKIEIPHRVEGSLPVPVRKSSFIAVGLSGIFPGLGHIYLNDMRSAGLMMGGAGISIGLSSIPNEELSFTALYTYQNEWFYGMYAAYRDTHAFNGAAQYTYRMPSDSLTDLTLAPFRYAVWKKPEVWGGVLGWLAAGVALTLLFDPDYKHAARTAYPFASTSEINPLVALPVGIGEEAFFRGFLQSTLIENSNPVLGSVLSSLAFGGMHIPNAAELDLKARANYYLVSVPFISAFGGYFSWLAYKNHSLKEAVAVHFWYDFTLFLVSYLTAPPAAIGIPPLKISFAF
ncbi:MAG: hypothetical protein A3F09_03155 [Chlamydiae bacterium RIFCSPHIGHO2_12_FULL_49_11]|nr:MAG: hypothetical protein A3F09_03155 [Chlamydiae bacterium RIFCSPHIGHO2_12_FULL_49_11]